MNSFVTLHNCETKFKSEVFRLCQTNTAISTFCLYFYSDYSHELLREANIAITKNNNKHSIKKNERVSCIRAANCSWSGGFCHNFLFFWWNQICFVQHFYKKGSYCHRLAHPRISLLIQNWATCVSSTVILFYFIWYSIYFPGKIEKKLEWVFKEFSPYFRWTWISTTDAGARYVGVYNLSTAQSIFATLHQFKVEWVGWITNWIR